MTKTAPTTSFFGAFKASAVVFAVSIVLGAGASHAIVTTAPRVLVKSATTGQPISFSDARRLPQHDDTGAPVRPLFSTVAR